MQYTYTAVITEKDGTFYAKVPDVDGCITTASTLAEAIALITDALNLCLVGLEDEEITPNEPTPQSEIPHLPTDILTIIQADTIKYRSMTDTKAVRKNVSLPAWMSKLADKLFKSIAGSTYHQTFRKSVFLPRRPPYVPTYPIRSPSHDL